MPKFLGLRFLKQTKLIKEAKLALLKLRRARAPFVPQFSLLSARHQLSAVPPNKVFKRTSLPSAWPRP